MNGPFTFQHYIILGIIVIAFLLWFAIPVIIYHRFCKQLSLRILEADSEEGLMRLKSFLSSGFGWMFGFNIGTLIIPKDFYRRCSPELCADLFRVFLPRLSTKPRNRVELRRTLSNIERHLKKEPEHYLRIVRERLRDYLGGQPAQRYDPVGILLKKIEERES